MMKLWETEHFTLNFLTGELQRVISDIYYEGVNFEQGQLSLVRSNKPWLRLTGNWYRQSSKSRTFLELENTTPIVTPNVEGKSETLKDLQGFISGLSVDDICDWLDTCSEDYIRNVLEKFKVGKLDAYVKIIEGHLKHKYGKKDDEGTQQSD